MIKIASIVGARPQFVKAGVVSRALRGGGAREVLVHTGQHYDENMSKIFFDELEIPRPDYDLGVGSGEHGAQTGRMLEAIEKVLLAERPDWVLVYGDTNSTLAGALAAVKLHIPVAHVEAGLRSFNRRMPEEINRVLTDHASTLLFVPTDLAVENLASEGIIGDKVSLVGDVMYDAALHYGERAEKQSHALKRLGLAPRGYILSTVHRAENTDDPSRLRSIFTAFCELAQEIPIVLPLHPRTRNVLAREGFTDLYPGLKMIDPVGYLDMVMLEKNARVIATDSGGVQKEAFFYRVPCVTLRDETEWVELVELGWNRLAPVQDTPALLSTMRAALNAGPGKEASPYGDGHSSERIRDVLLNTTAQSATSLA
jgi:UDP-GlcNAc3NAcA epimerase